MTADEARGAGRGRGGPGLPDGAGEALRSLAGGARSLTGAVLVAVALPGTDGSLPYRALAWDECGPVQVGGGGLEGACAPGPGPGGPAWRSGRPVVVADAVSDPAFRPWREEVERRGIRSAAFVPLKFRGEVVGVLGAFLDRPGGLPPQQVAVLESLGGLAGSALALAERSARLRRRVGELTLWERACRLLVPLGGEQDVLDVIAGEFLDLVRGDAVLVRIADEGDDEWVTRRVRTAARVPSLSVACAALAATRPSRDRPPRVRHFCDATPGATSGSGSGELVLRSGYLVPLAVGGSLLGQVVVGFRGVHPFSADEERALEVLAERAAVSLLNALLYERERHEARTDSLTGLWNHRSLLQFLSHELARTRLAGEDIALLFIDLDGFKAINDRWGHPEGDALLRRIGSVSALATPPGGYACRYGGDEFAVLLPGAGPAEAAAVAEDLRRAVAEAGRRYVPRGALPVTASIGVASFPARECTVAGLVRAANAAMYAAKDGGRNRVQAVGPTAAAPGAGELAEDAGGGRRP